METMYILIKGGGNKFHLLCPQFTIHNKFCYGEREREGGGGAIAMLIKMKIKINLNGLK